MALTVKERIQFYVGDADHADPLPLDGKSGFDKPVLITGDTYHPGIHQGTMYPMDVYRLLSHSKTKRLWINCGDWTYRDTKYPVMIKVREEGSHGVIANLDSRRHWGEIGRHPDPSWDQKLDKAFWRGADTGRGVRLDFVRQFWGHLDVGFSQYVQDALKDPASYPRQYVKGVAPIGEFLKHKYLPVVDGNDKSSSLNWVLASNSVPLMPKPKYHSWLCEKFLVAGYHYVEVSRDFSDLPEKIEWCRAHDDECRQIAENGKEFMKQFQNAETEVLLEKLVVAFCER
jgi:hypothetical protein